MNIQTSKIELVKIILNIENDEFINRISEFINKEKKDFWSELNKSEQKEIQVGIEQLKNGKRVSYKDFLKSIS